MVIYIFHKTKNDKLKREGRVKIIISLYKITGY